MNIMNAFWSRGSTKADTVANASASDSAASGDDGKHAGVEDTSQASTTPSPPAPAEDDVLRASVIAALRTIYDPEIPVNIYDLGLIYELDIDDEGRVDLRMTLTTPACPVAASFPETVERRLYEVPGVAEVRVELVWDPPWTMDRLTEETRLQLGLL